MMWDGLPLLVLLCLFMGGISFLVGSLPLTLSLSARQLRIITALGTGVLVGTALIVIIPEGIETLYSASSNGSGDSHGAAARSLPSTRDAVAASGAFDTVWITPRHEMPALLEDTVQWNARSNEARSAAPLPETPSSDAVETPEQTDDNETESDEQTHDPHAWVGVSLITGLILMYLIDTLPKHAITSSRPERFHISLNQFSLHRSSTSSLPTDTETPSANGDYRPNDPQTSSQQSRPSSTTVGLVIHAVADGIALGASSTTTSRLSFIIFIALLIHKAPAAFGLTSVLLKQGLSKRMARAHLAIFSLAAPVGALLTWLGAHLLGFASSLESGSGTEFATGVLLLFSAGTFLYVAMHTMQETGSDHAHGANGYSGVPSSVYGEPQPPPPAKSTEKLADTLFTVAGMLVPLLTQFGHGH